MTTVLQATGIWCLLSAATVIGWNVGKAVARRRNTNPDDVVLAEAERIILEAQARDLARIDAIARYTLQARWNHPAVRHYLKGDDQ